MSASEKKSQEIRKDKTLRVAGLPQSQLPDGGLGGMEPVTGMTGEGSTLTGVAKEYSGWDVYNNEAKKVDRELVKDWTSNLNSLLLFAAIFAAVLTAFIIESKKMLEQDPSSVMMDVMILLTNNLANGTHTSFVQTNFEAPSSAVTINSLFFASLGTSLGAALASVVALQWVADYDAAITRGGSSPEDRAKRRQFRHAGVVWWRMGEIIAAIPLLLYCSVVLFFGGLSLWMWTINRVVGAVFTGGVAIAILFYVGTTFLAVIFVSTPFRTPLSRWIYSLCHLPFSITYWSTIPMRLSTSVSTWLEERHLRFMRPGKREDREVEKRSELGINAIVWLANQLSVSQDSYDRLLLLANELPKLQQEISVFLGFGDAPWFSIFDLLGWKHSWKGPDTEITAEEMRAVEILAQCYRIPKIYSIISPTDSMQPIRDSMAKEYWPQHCGKAGVRWVPNPRPTVPNSLFLYLRDIPLPSENTVNQLESTIRLSRWRNSPLKQHAIWGEVLDLGVMAFPTFIGEFIALLSQYLRANEESFQEDDELLALYTGIVSRIVWSLIKGEGKVSPPSLHLLRRCFGSLLMEPGTYINVASRLSSPLLYHERLLPRNNPRILRKLHYAFTLLLAKQLSSCNDYERVQRVNEVILMLWVSPVRFLKPANMDPQQGMERFFQANRTHVMGWIEDSHEIPYIHEILHHLAIAQQEQPDIGPLWRAAAPQMGANLRFIETLWEFQALMRQNATPEQHRILVHLVCQDLDLGPSESFRYYFTDERLRKLRGIADPCLLTLVKSIGGSNAEYLPIPVVEITDSRKESWARVATYLMRHHEATEASPILQLQASLWPVIPDRVVYCKRALHEPHILAHLQRMFGYHIPCTDHYDSEGHVLLHVSESLPSLGFPPGLNPFTNAEGRLTTPLLAIMLHIFANREELVLDELREDINPQSLAQILQVLRVVNTKQSSLLALLADISVSLVDDGDTTSDDLGALSLCVIQALDLPCDRRVVSIIHPLVNRILQVKDAMLAKGYGLPMERESARAEANRLANKLTTHFTMISVFGVRNCRALSCARTKEAYSPAVGWMEPYYN